MEIQASHLAKCERVSTLVQLMVMTAGYTGCAAVDWFSVVYAAAGVWQRFGLSLRGGDRTV